MKEVPKAFFVTHGELDAAMELADSLGRNLGTATYIPHFGDCAEIHGTEWQMHESEMVQVEPAAIDLRATCVAWNTIICCSAAKSNRLWRVTRIRRLWYARSWKSCISTWMIS